MAPTNQGALLAAGEQQMAMQPVVVEDNVTPMFERLAKDPAVDVEKLERLMGMHERMIKQQAKADFDRDYSQMQGDIPVITEKGEIVVKGELRSKYATNEDIQEAVKPILQRYGFALRFRNQVVEGRLKVTGILSHRSGHSEEDEFVTKPDDSGSKNDIQAIGSARSYGQRYTTIALLNIATRGTDDDGQRAGDKPKDKESKAPAGYDDWLITLETVASDGMPAFADFWNKSKDEHRKYLASTAPKLLANIKNKANRKAEAAS
jgi:hypothetical protein